jgi:hypothetical protein
VEPSDYNACNTTSYVKRFTDGDTTFTLDHSGAFFFTSGVEANCRANEKLIVMVLAGGPNGSAPVGAFHHPTPGADHRTTTFIAVGSPTCQTQHAATCFVVIIAPFCDSTVHPAICAGRRCPAAVLC